MANPRVELDVSGTPQAVIGVQHGDNYYIYRNKHESEEEKQAVAILEPERINQIWDSFCQHLKIEYRKGKYIQRLFYPDDPLPLERSYIHLTLVDDKQGSETESKLQQVYNKRKHRNRPAWIKSSIKDICLMPDNLESLECDKLYVRKNGTDLDYAIVGEGEADIQRGSLPQEALENICQVEERERVSAIFESEVFDLEQIRPFLAGILRSIEGYQQHIYHQETEIVRTYEEIFNPSRSSPLSEVIGCKHVLITGIAGVGKTTLSQYLCYLWAEEENNSTHVPFNEIEKIALKKWRAQTNIVIRVALRDLMNDSFQITSETTVIDFLWDYLKSQYDQSLFFEEPSLDPTSIKEVVKSRLNQEQTAGRLVLILDGYDEVAKEVYELKHLERMLKKLLAMPRLILTSRPYYLDDLSSKYRCSFEKTYRVTGFSDENISQYIDNFFSNLVQPKKELGIALQNYFQRNRSLWGTCHIPINLELICSAWDKEKFREKSLTITELYNKIIFFLCKRYLQKCNKDISTMPSEDILEECADEMDFLKHLAFMGILKQEVVTSLRDSLNYMTEKIHLASNHPREWRSQFIRKMLKAGFLKSIGTGESEADKHYYFPHRTFQEYFAARYFVDCFLNQRALPAEKKRKAPESPLSYILENRYDVNLEVMWWFVSGQLFLYQHDNPSSRCLLDFFKILLRCTDEIGHYRFMLAVRCWDEARAMKELLNTDMQNSLSFGLEILLVNTTLSTPLLERLLLSGFVRRSAFLNHFIAKKINLYLDTEKGDNYAALRRSIILFFNKMEIIPDSELLHQLLSIVKDNTKKYQPIIMGYLVRLLLQLEDETESIEARFLHILNNYFSTEHQWLLYQNIDEMSFTVDKAEVPLRWLEHENVCLQQLSLILMEKSDYLFFRNHFERVLINFLEHEQSSELYLSVVSVLYHQGSRVKLKDDLVPPEKILQRLVRMNDNKEKMITTSKYHAQLYSLFSREFLLQKIDFLIQKLADLDVPCAISGMGRAILSRLAEEESRMDLLMPEHLIMLKKLLARQPYEPDVKALGIELLNQLPLFVQRSIILKLLLAKDDENFLIHLSRYFRNLRFRSAKIVSLEEDSPNIVEQWKQKNPSSGEILVIKRNEAWEAHLVLMNESAVNLIQSESKLTSEDLNCTRESELNIPLFTIEKQTVPFSHFLNQIIKREIDNNLSERVLLDSRLKYFRNLFMYEIQWRKLLPFIISSHPMVSNTALDITARIINRCSLEDQKACYQALIKDFTRVPILTQEKILYIMMSNPIVPGNKEADCNLEPPLNLIISILMFYFIEGNVEQKILALPWLFLDLPLIEEDKKKCIDNGIKFLTHSHPIQFDYLIFQYFLAIHLLFLFMPKKEPAKYATPEDFQEEEKHTSRPQDKFQHNYFQFYHQQIMEGSNEEGKRAWNYALCTLPDSLREIIKEDVLHQEINAVYKLDMLTIFFYRHFSQRPIIQWWQSESALHAEADKNPYVILPAPLVEECRQSQRWVKSYTKEQYPAINYYFIHYSLHFVRDNISVITQLFCLEHEFFQLDQLNKSPYIRIIDNNFFDLPFDYSFCMDSDEEFDGYKSPGCRYRVKPEPALVNFFRSMKEKMVLDNLFIGKLLKSKIYTDIVQATIDFLSKKNLSEELGNLDFSQIKQSDLQNILKETPLHSILEHYFAFKNKQLIPIIVNRLAKENKTMEIKKAHIHLYGKIVELVPHTLTDSEQLSFSQRLRRSFSEMHCVNLTLLGVTSPLEAASAGYVLELEEKKQAPEVQENREEKETARYNLIRHEEHPKIGKIICGCMVILGIALLIEQSTKKQNNSYLQTVSPWLFILLGGILFFDYKGYNRLLPSYGLFRRVTVIPQENLENNKREDVLQQRLLHPR
jgi:hypothetical protein